MKTINLFGCLILLCFASFAVAQDDADADAVVAVGDMAPDFELETLGGETVTLSDHFGEDGKPVVLLFSRASW